VRTPPPVRASVHPRTRLVLNALLLVLVVAAVLFWFRAYLESSVVDPERVQLYQDASTYLAAAERVESGHRLYEFWEGDRPILMIPGVTVAPLLSPPPIAALWMVIAAVPLGFALWVLASWVSTLAVVAYSVLKAPLPAAPFAFLLSLPLGEQIFGANATAFSPLLYLLAWKVRARPWVGVLIAFVASVKLAPIALVGWLLGTRRYRAALVTLVALVAAFVLGGVGTGFVSYVDYIRVIPTADPSPLSVSGITGVRWASFAVLAIGSAAAILVGRRSDGAAYALAVLTAVLGTPALFPGHLAALLAVVAPLTDRRRVAAGGAEAVAPPTAPTVAAAEA
jgi:glycosyl transferase family 87